MRVSGGPCGGGSQEDRAYMANYTKWATHTYRASVYRARGEALSLVICPSLSFSLYVSTERVYT